MLDFNAVNTRLTSVFHDVFENDSIVLSRDMTANDVDGWDSVAHITLIVAVEKEFDIRLTVEEIGKLDNVGSLIAIIAERASE